MLKYVGFLMLIICMCGCSSAKDKITVNSMYDTPPQGGYTKIYPVSYDVAYQTTLEVCADLDLVVELEDKEDNVIILWGDMDEKIDEELIGIYFDPYHETRTAIRVVTPSMDYEEEEWEEMDKADPWGRRIHKKLGKRLK